MSFETAELACWYPAGPAAYLQVRFPRGPGGGLAVDGNIQNMHRNVNPAAWAKLGPLVGIISYTILFHS